MIPISYRANGSTSNIERVFLYKDSGATAGTEGDPFTGLAFNTANLSIATIANNEATANVDTTAATSSVETIATLGTYATPTAGFVRFKEVDATNMPGLYELQWENARYAVASAKYLDICITGVADLATFTGRVYLDIMDATAVQASVDAALVAYDSAAGVVSNTDLNARSIVAATIPTTTTISTLSTTVTDGNAAILADLLATAQVLARSDAANATDNTAKVDEINTDNGSGVGNFAVTTDSLEAQADVSTEARLAELDAGNLPATTDAGATAAALATTDAVCDAIKVKTDQMVFTKANELDVNTVSINNAEVVGDGNATPWDGV